MKAIIYCRKSTDEKGKQVQSLDTQLNWATEYCNKNNIDVISTVIQPESAQKPGRVGFAEVMRVIEMGEADTIISITIDRLSRNPIDSGRIQYMLQLGQIKHIVTSTKIYNADDAGLLFSVESGMANEFILKLKKAVKFGMDTKIRNGGYITKVPFGYINNVISKTVEVDEFRKIFVKRMFEMRADGHSVQLITDVLAEEGLRTPGGKKYAKPTIEKNLKNPIYYGYYNRNGDMMKLNHPPIISRELFNKVDSITRGVKYVHNRELSPLQGLVSHKESGILMCCSLIKKKYIYFHLHSRQGKLWFNENLILKYFDENIYNYFITPNITTAIMDSLYNEHMQSYKENSEEKNILQKRVDKLDKEKGGLMKMRRREEITEEEFKEEKLELSKEIESIKFQLDKLNQYNDKILEDFNTLVELLPNMINKRKTSDTNKKLEIIKNFVVELKIDNQKRLYIKEKPIYKALREHNFKNWSEGRGLNSHTQGLKP